MRYFRTICTKVGLLLVLMICIQCVSQKMDSVVPVDIENPYFVKIDDGTRDKGFVIYIPIKRDVSITLENVYFKGKKVALTYKAKDQLYIGHYTYPKKQTMVMSSDPKEEFKNQVPIVEEKIPFDLKDNECVVGYTQNGKEKFFKIENLQEKEMETPSM